MAQRYKPEQIVTMLRQIEVSIANEKTIPQACKEAAISVQTFYRCGKECNGSKVGVHHGAHTKSQTSHRLLQEFALPPQACGESYGENLTLSSEK